MAENHVVINGELCKECGLCIEVCPRGCLAVGSKLNQHGWRYVEFEGERCTACGFCYSICPEPGAITVYKKKGNNGL